MGLTLRRILSAFLLIQAWSITNGQKSFPTMDEIFEYFYESEVQITDLYTNSTAFAKEYYSDVENQGRLDLLISGERVSLFYFNETGDILEVNETACVAKPMANSFYSKQGIFYGWLRLKPIVIGPSALFWFVNDTKDGIKKTVEYQDKKESIRGIKCDHYKVTVDQKGTQVTYHFYFADSAWKTPNGNNGKRIPIRIAFDGVTADYMPGSLVPVNQVIDFSYYRPIISDLTKLWPPIGLGCFGMESEKYLPDIEDEFMFFEEELDLLEAAVHEDISVNFNGIFFDAGRQLARFDKHTRKGYSSQLYDFNNGVTYSLDNELTCKIDPLMHSFFEIDGDGKFGGTMKTAKEVLGLTGDFYFLGNRKWRGINVDVYEKAELSSSFINANDFLTVITAFFTEDLTETITNAEDMVNIPVYFLVTMYDTPNHMVYQKQYNVFGFDDVVGPAIHEYFPLQDCFPLSQQKSYFVLIMREEPAEVAELIENNDGQFMMAIKSEIMKTTGVSELRIPFLKIDYQGQQIVATGMLLDRPPALKQFHFAYNGPTVASAKMKIIAEARSPNECAYACVDDPKCRGFDFCGEKAPVKGVCFLDIPSETTSDNMNDFDNCYIYYRAEMNSNNNDKYLGVVLEKLNDVVLSDKTFKIPVQLDEKTRVELTVSEIVFGDGPFDKSPTDKDYNLVFNGFQLNPPSESQVTIEREYIDTELECYRSCKLEESMSCESFSYCPQGDKKQCRITSEFFTKDMVKPKNVIANQNCNVYSLMYLDFYNKNEGKVLMGQGDAAFEKINSTEECAMKCKQEVDLPCRGFDYCRSMKTCVLHSTHISDTHPSHIVDPKDKGCMHYSAKFTADYLNKGHNIIDDDASDTRKSVTVEQCARSCSEENPSCRAFVYCPGFSTEDSTCSLTKKTLVSKDVKLKDDAKCTLYTKKKGIKDWEAEKVPVVPEATGYTKSGFTGLVIGTIVFGLIIGVIGFVGYSYYRSRQPVDGMTVRFMKQTNA